MKLRNKKTGEIMPASNIAVGIGKDGKWYDSLAELNEEWEDYEEPKEYWYIDCDGEVYSTDRLNGFDLDRMLNIGNRFNSREEAEKTVEKLKAWKRLKDAGFGFIGKSIEYKEDKHFGSVFYEITDDILNMYDDVSYFNDDLYLLFGGNQ